MRARRALLKTCGHKHDTYPPAFSFPLSPLSVYLPCRLLVSKTPLMDAYVLENDASLRHDSAASATAEGITFVADLCPHPLRLKETLVHSEALKHVERSCSLSSTGQARASVDVTFVLLCLCMCLSYGRLSSRVSRSILKDTFDRYTTHSAVSSFGQFFT